MSLQQAIPTLLMKQWADQASIFGTRNFYNVSQLCPINFLFTAELLPLKNSKIGHSYRTESNKNPSTRIDNLFLDQLWTNLSRGIWVSSTKTAAVPVIATRLSCRWPNFRYMLSEAAQLQFKLTVLSSRRVPRQHCLILRLWPVLVLVYYFLLQLSKLKVL